MPESDKLWWNESWRIETTWLDLPVSVQHCALTGRRSALLFIVAFVYKLWLKRFLTSVFYLSPLLGTVLYTDMNSICVPVFILVKEENKEALTDLTKTEKKNVTCKWCLVIYMGITVKLIFSYISAFIQLMQLFD